MTKQLTAALTYVLFGVAATALVFFMSAGALAGVIGQVTFGVLFTACIFAGNKLEGHVFAALGQENSNNIIINIAVRTAFYALVPAALILLVHTFAPAVILFPSGWSTLFQLVWMPLLVAAILRLVPAN